MINNKRVLIVISGSIAAYKILDLIRLLKKSGYQITTIMTKAAQEFITPLLVSSISENEVYKDLFSLDEESKMGHINLSRENDLILVAPASANIIGKINNGIADDLASTVLLAANKPIFMAPAMNEKMWIHKNTQKNLNELKEKDIKIIEPQQDILACGEYGIGKMADIEDIFAKIDGFFAKKAQFLGQNIIISAGATYEPIDPVRFIGNYSSGKQAIKIAEKLADLGANVTLIAANIRENINLNPKNIIRVKTAQEMMLAIEKRIKKTDIFIACAAVADFKPKNYSKEKIKKDQNNFDKIELEENIDILKTIGNSQNRPKIVIGFAAESTDLIKNAQKKLQQKNCDLIIANNIDNGAVFGSDYNKISILDKDGKKQDFAKTTKTEIANIIAEKLINLIN